jgi:hypothetical protein
VLHDPVDHDLVGVEQLGRSLPGGGEERIAGEVAVVVLRGGAGGDDGGRGDEGLDQVSLGAVVVVAVGEVCLVAGHADDQVDPVAFGGVSEVLEGEGALAAAVGHRLDVQSEDLPAEGPARDGVGGLVAGPAAQDLRWSQAAGHPGQRRGKGHGGSDTVASTLDVGVIPHGGGSVPYHWGRFRGLADMMGTPGHADLLLENVFFDTCVYHQPGINLLTEVIPSSSILFASEMIGAVRGIDDRTGHYYDDTKRYVDATPNLTDDERAAIYEANIRRSTRGSTPS